MIDDAKDSGLKLEIVQENGQATEIWYYGGLNADMWENTAVNIDEQKSPFKVYFV